MKKQSGIWIDSSQAIIVDLHEGYEDVQIINSSVDNKIHHDGEGDRGTRHGAQWVNNEKKFDERKKNQIRDYLTGIIKEIEERQVDELFLFGPASTKSQLNEMIAERKDFSEISVSEVTADSMTTNQVVQQVKLHFGKE